MVGGFAAGGLMGAVGSAAGFSNGLVQAHAADPTGGNIANFAIGGVMGSVFGAANPAAGLLGLGGSAAGGAIGSALGNTNMGVQIGGLLGDIAGAGVDDVFRAMGKGAGKWAAVKHGAGQVGVTLGVASAAGGAAYWATDGDLNSALTVANLASIPGNLLAQKIVPCFPAGTLVLTPEGHTAIEDLRAGDLVLSRPEEDLGTSPPTPQVVEEVFTREGQLFELVIAGRVLRTTPEHPFFVEGQGWTPAGELHSGNLLSTATGEWLPVESITNTHPPVGLGLQLPSQRLPHRFHRAGRCGVWLLGA